MNLKFKRRQCSRRIFAHTALLNVRQTDALESCLRLPGCNSLVCPDPTPYRGGQPNKNIEGEICQARVDEKGVADEKGHGMCAPGGCGILVLQAQTLGDVVFRPCIGP